MESLNLDELLDKFIKFGLVGFLGLLIDFGITFLLKEKFGFNKYVANFWGFIIAVCSNFVFNKLWTFQDGQAAYLTQFLTFLAVAAGGLLINQGLLYLLHEKFKLKFYFAKIGAIGVVTFWNFGLSNFLVFAP
ncbi:MAG: putative flippase GtrA [Algoriphagus sp.]|jgi:putative flippase GtrA